MKNIHAYSEDLLKQLSEDDALLVELIKSDLKSSIDKIRSSVVDLYGYAILPGDYFEVGSLVAAFNKESDIKPAELASTIYYKYSVDEWMNYDRDVFQKSNTILEKRNVILQEFCDRHEDQHEVEIEDLKIRFADSIYELILDALNKFRKEFCQDSDLFLVIWVADSGNSIVNRSAAELNSASVSELFFTEFHT